MPKKSADAGEGIQPQGEDFPVYDFLYQDSRRIGAFLAQFQPHGPVQSVKEVFAAGSTARHSGGMEFQGNAVIATAKGETTEEISETESEGGERTYDPFWQNALLLLSLLNQTRWLNRKIEAARLGQFALISGALDIYDCPAFKGFVDILEPLTRIRPFLADADDGKPPRTDHSMLKRLREYPKLFKALPFSIQATLSTETDTSIWCILSPDNLTISATDLFLKYGITVPGTWSMLGVVDALPQPAAGADPGVAPKEKSVSNTMLEAMRASEVISVHLGRPRSSYGITPLLVFREVSK